MPDYTVIGFPPPAPVNPTQAPAPATGPVNAQPITINAQDPTIRLEHEIETLRQRQKWHTALWWTIFVLWILGVGGLVFLHVWDIRELRRETLSGQSDLGKRVDDTRTRDDDQLQSRAGTLETRIDQLTQQVSDLRTELTAVQTRVDDLTCTPGCFAADK